MKKLNRFLKKFCRKLTRECNYLEVDYYTLQQMMKEDSQIILLDVRSVQEFKEGHLLGAINIPLSDIKNKVELLISNKGQRIIVYCQMGGRSKKAVNLLCKMGYTNVYQLNGGLDAI